jgi:hypothetical protein
MSTLIQAFPKKGILAANLDVRLSELKMRIEKKGEAAARSYVVASVKLDDSGLRFEQHGSTPNFQGRCLTICTCKHRMRTPLEVPDWQGKWVAGFTSRSLKDNRHWLFFLTQIANAYESHFDLWNALPGCGRVFKSAETNRLGDVFPPRGGLTGAARLNPKNYLVSNQCVRVANVME